MKKLFLLSLMLISTLCLSAQDAVLARKILDKTAAVVGRAGGASASFNISNAKIGSKAGTIAIKGTKFHARTPKAIVGFDGKTQWSYLKLTNEVNHRSQANEHEPLHVYYHVQERVQPRCKQKRQELCGSYDGREHKTKRTGGVYYD